MTIHEKKQLIQGELQKNDGILRFAPCWVARNFMQPGRRLKLDPRDYYAYGGAKGGIDERWFASTTPADNAEYTIENEGLSFVVVKTSGGHEQILFKEIIDFMGNEIIGEEQMNKYGRWMMFSKFFDNMGPIAHHVHLMDEQAKNVDMLGKPEGYYFPPQQNNVYNNFPHTYFGLNPGVTKDDVIRCLKEWADRGDNNILDLSRAYRLQVGTGWDVPPGVLHAPGSLLTYEPQRASDVSIFFQAQVEGRYNSRDTLVKDVPKDKYDDYEYIFNILNWELNVDPNFKENHFILPVPAADEKTMTEKGYSEKWVVYGSKDFSAKELTVFPNQTVTITDAQAYGLIMMQGHGTLNKVKIETPTMIRFGDLTSDELFVTETAAKKGVVISNHSDYENIVMLKHFGPNNPEAARLVKTYKV
jgi:mannose-6-phosphate isomerase class I